MVTEKNNFSSNAQYNSVKSKITSTCKNDKPWKPYSILPTSINFQIHSSEGGN